MFFTPEDVAGSLDADDWTIVVCEARERAATGHAGASHSVGDAVVRARHRNQR